MENSRTEITHVGPVNFQGFQLMFMLRGKLAEDSSLKNTVPREKIGQIDVVYIHIELVASLNIVDVVT